MNIERGERDNRGWFCVGRERKSIHSSMFPRNLLWFKISRSTLIVFPSDLLMMDEGNIRLRRSIIENGVKDESKLMLKIEVSRFIFEGKADNEE